MRPAVAIRQVHKHFGNLHAVRGVNFDIHPGEFFGLLGPNGAGKSTLINMMAGLVRPSSGRLAVMGHDVQADYRRARHALGVVPQELVYDPFFTVREMLRLQSGYFGLGRGNDAWIDELLATLNLTEKASANLHDLSGGMKRRVLIAQALVHKPPVVVLDEPTAGVDVELRQALWRFTRRLHADGHTIILTTHYLEEAEALCERIAILNHGALVALDSKESLLSRNPYRKLRVTVGEGATPLPESLERLVVAREGTHMTLRLHRSEDPIGAVLEGFRSAGVEILDLHTDEAGLEEVFIHMTAGEEGLG
jgi:ABC-2 type transport system ATP-binding protein